MEELIKYGRISFDEMYMELVSLLEKRSTCLSRKVGAVLVKNNVLLSTGYNGAPAGLEHCEVCLRRKDGIKSGERLEYCRASHAEQNALIQCALKQTNPNGATLYCSTSPCITCAKLLIQAGIKTIIYKEKYNDDLAWKMLEEAGVILLEW